MANLIGEWAWILAFFPVWAVMAVIWFSLAVGPKRAVGPRMNRVLDGAAMALSISSAAGILIGLDCGSFISLPFNDQVCRSAATQLTVMGVF